MNKLPFLLMLWLCCATVLSAQNFYTIQLGTFLDAQREDFSAIQPLGFIHADKTGTNLYVIYVGGYSNRATAEKAWEQVRNKGYVNAFIQERIPAQGQSVTMIQIATRNSTKPIPWEEYARLGELYASIEGTSVKILTGTYANVDAAKPALDAIKKAGFKDAFIKNMNTIYLHKLSEFETDLKKPLIPLTLNNNAPANTQQTPPSYDTRSNNSNIPTIYDQGIFTAKTPQQTVNTPAPT
ncbi:MAG: SPOR domain-containing protein, partial [Saprospiraceae bacterium]